MTLILGYFFLRACICSAPTRNLRNPRIAQRELGIHTLAPNPGIARRIPLLRTRDVEQTFDLSYFIASSCYKWRTRSVQQLSRDIGRSLKSFAAQLSLIMILKAARQSPETRSSIYSTKIYKDQENYSPKFRHWVKTRGSSSCHIQLLDSRMYFVYQPKLM